MMNKYQEAFDHINKNLDLETFKFNTILGIEMLSRIEELVDKATPMKPKPLFIPIAYLPYRCPVCGTLVNHKKDKFNYCPNCGQKIDWGN